MLNKNQNLSLILFYSVLLYDARWSVHLVRIVMLTGCFMIRDVVKRPQLPNEKSAAVILQGYAVESTRGYGLVGPRSPLLCCKGDSTILRTCNFDYCLLMLSVALGTYFEHHLLILTGPAKQDSAKARNLKRLKRERNDVPVETVV